MGKHAAPAEVTDNAMHRNLNAEQFHLSSGGSTLSANTGKRAKPQPETMGSADLRARGL
jgi:hypothetical protein